MNIMMNSITDEGWRGYQPLPDTGHILTIIVPDLGNLPRHSLREPIRWNSTGFTCDISPVGMEICT